MNNEDIIQELKEIKELSMDPPVHERIRNLIEWLEATK